MKTLSKIFVVLSLVFSNHYGWSQIHSNDFKEPYEDNHGKPLKGSVIKIEEEKYSVIDYFGELKKDSIYEVSQYNLNDKNYPLSAKIIDFKKGETTAEWTYINNKTKEVIVKQNDVVIEQVKFEFDDRGNIIECSSFKNGVLDSKEFAVYNENNKEIEYKRYNDKGIIAERTITKYDLNGRELEYEWHSEWKGKLVYKYMNGKKTEMLYFSDDKLKEKNYYKYNSTGIIKEEISEDIESNHKIIYYYNSKGNLIERVFFDSYGGKEILETNKYDVDNRIVYEDEGYWKKYYEYDNKGNLIKEETHYKSENSNLTKKIILFEYDVKGNWVKSIESNFYVGNPIESPKKIITERKIIYR
jgi:hypothetical protein